MEAGAQWYNVYKFADEHNVTVVGGYHPTVGASGGWLMVLPPSDFPLLAALTHFKGAGYSVLTPTLGLGVDRVVRYTCFLRLILLTNGFLPATIQDRDPRWRLQNGQ
jgi:hypothetical protein